MKPAFVLILILTAAGNTAAQQDAGVTERNDSVTIQFVDTELRVAVQALARHLDRPLLFGAIGDARVTLETPRPVPRTGIYELIRGLLESHNYELIADSGHYRVRQKPDNPVSRSGPVSEQGGPVQLYVIRLRHASASDVAATINALYGRASALGELAGRPAGLTQELRENRVPLAGVPVRENVTPTTMPATLTGEVTIVPDAGTNSLLIRANQSDFELIQAAVEQLDVRPLQVLIEVLIAEVRRDRSRAFGLSLGLDSTRVPDRLGVPGTVTGASEGLDVGDFVLHLMTTGDIELEATLRAAAARGDVRIRSQPVLVAANNEVAQILVGSQRPFVQVSRSLPTDTPTRDQVVQYKDVGTMLNIHPTISTDGYVMLDVTQEVNAATTETAFDAPVISTRSIQTRLLVRDGQTAVLGGLTDEQRDQAKGGVPFLSEIPLIGWLFGSSVRRTVATELFVFITPRVIRDDSDIDEATRPLLRRSEGIRK